jgi:hypothetical protein
MDDNAKRKMENPDDTKLMELIERKATADDPNSGWIVALLCVRILRRLSAIEGALAIPVDEDQLPSLAERKRWTIAELLEGIDGKLSTLIKEGK